MTFLDFSRRSLRPRFSSRSTRGMRLIRVASQTPFRCARCKDIGVAGNSHGAIVGLGSCSP